MRNHPIHVVTAWLGNTPNVALKHYLQTLDADFQKALAGGAESGAVPVQNAVRPASTGIAPDVTEAMECSGNKVSRRVLLSTVHSSTTEQMPRLGLEPKTR